MSIPPQQVIRHYLDDHGGETDATVDHLLRTFGVSSVAGNGHTGIAEALWSAGIATDRPLDGLSREEAVRLFVQNRSAGEAPTSEIPGFVPPPEGDGNPASGPGWRRRIGLSALILALATGLLAGGFLYGQSTRKSDAEVRQVVKSAVAKRAQQDRLEAKKALLAQRRDLNREMTRRVKKAKDEAFASGRQQGVNAGYASGQASGRDAGREEGYTQGAGDGYFFGSIDGYLDGYDEGSAGADTGSSGSSYDSSDCIDYGDC